MNNYLALEPLLVAELERILDGAAEVRLFDSLNRTTELSKPVTVFVGYAGDTREGEVRGVTQRWTQQWLTVAVVRALKPGEQLRVEAGQIIATLIEGLGGWTPDRQRYGPLSRNTGTGTRYEPGYVEFPLQWETTLTIRSNPHG